MTAKQRLSFEDNLEVFRQLQAPEERAEFMRLMKRAYTDGISGCTFVQRSVARHVSSTIRHLCAAALAAGSDLSTRESNDPAGDGDAMGALLKRPSQPTDD